MSPATWMPRRTPTSTYLAGIIVVFVVAALYWCARKSAVVVPDLVIEGEPITPTLTLFQRLNWLWSCLFLLPGLYLGAAEFRPSVLCGSLAYGIGTVLGWWVAESGIVLADPLLRPQLERMLAQGFGFAAARGVLRWLSSTTRAAAAIKGKWYPISAPKIGGFPVSRNLVPFEQL